MSEINHSQDERTIYITPEALPLHCAGAQTDVWNGHPRVFLPIESYSSVDCPYCGAIYHLQGEAKGHH